MTLTMMLDALAVAGTVALLAFGGGAYIAKANHQGHVNAKVARIHVADARPVTAAARGIE